MTNKKKIAIVSIIAFILIIAALLGIYFATREQPSEGDKTITVDIIYDDVIKTVELNTDAENLGDAMMAEGLMEGSGGPYGIYVTAVDGRVADESIQEWWNITKDGEYVDTGVDLTIITDGDNYEFTLQTGW